MVESGASEIAGGGDRGGVGCLGREDGARHRGFVAGVPDMGHLFERPLLEHYSRQTGMALTYPETMSPFESWMSATP